MVDTPLPTEYQVSVPSVFVYGAQGRVRRPVLTELLYGETFAVSHEENGLVYGLAPGERLLGAVERKALTRTCTKPTHLVHVRSTNVRIEHGFKSTPHLSLSFGSRVVVTRTHNGSVLVPGLGWIQAAHVCPYEAPECLDWVACAELFIGADYVWGGRSGVTGTDCSGLVVSAARFLGLYLPHNAAQIQKQCTKIGNRKIARGDLVFWEGHVGIMADGHYLIHATADARIRSVTCEPLRAVIRRRKAQPTLYGTLSGAG